MARPLKAFWLRVEFSAAYDMQPQQKAAVMTSKSLSQLPFPADCPRCHQTTGMVRGAGTVPHQPSIIRLTVRCETCQHQWVIDAVGESPYSRVNGMTGLRDEWHY
jgi:hypothetical protein